MCPFDEYSPHEVPLQEGTSTPAKAPAIVSIRPSEDELGKYLQERAQFRKKLLLADLPITEVEAQLKDYDVLHAPQNR
jgi:hypothetical protein